jgi:hypothetical protein
MKAFSFYFYATLFDTDFTGLICRQQRYCMAGQGRDTAALISVVVARNSCNF